MGGGVRLRVQVEDADAPAGAGEGGAEDYAALAREVLGETPIVLSARMEVDQRGNSSVIDVERQALPEPALPG